MKFLITRGQPYEYHEVTAQPIDLFSSSQVRKVAYDPYIGIPAQTLEAARQRGTRLHHRFAMLLGSTLNLCPCPKPIAGLEGFCTSMDEWVTRNQVKPILIEESSASLKFGYAGTPDALVTIGPKQFKALIDLKTGTRTPTDSLQLVMYSKMDGYEEAGFLVDVYIQADGSRAKEERVTPGMKATEWAWAMAALGVLQSRVNHGVS